MGRIFCTNVEQIPASESLTGWMVLENKLIRVLPLLTFLSISVCHAVFLNLDLKTNSPVLITRCEYLCYFSNFTRIPPGQMLFCSKAVRVLSNRKFNFNKCLMAKPGTAQKCLITLPWTGSQSAQLKWQLNFMD